MLLKLSVELFSFPNAKESIFKCHRLLHCCLVNMINAVYNPLDLHREIYFIVVFKCTTQQYPSIQPSIHFLFAYHCWCHTVHLTLHLNPTHEQECKTWTWGSDLLPAQRGRELWSQTLRYWVSSNLLQTCLQTTPVCGEGRVLKEPTPHHLQRAETIRKSWIIGPRPERNQNCSSWIWASFPAPRNTPRKAEQWETPIDGAHPTKM